MEVLEDNPQSYSSKSFAKNFTTILRDVPVGIAVFRGFDLKVEMASKTYLAIVDRDEKEFIGKPLFDTLPEVRYAVEPLLRNVMTSATPYYGNEFPVTLNRYGKSELTYFNFVYQPAIEDNGEVSGVIVVANEVTDTVVAKHRLAESEKKFRHFVMQSPIAMAILKGEELCIDLANKQILERIWRKKEHEVLGKNLLEVFPELKGQKYPELLKSVLATGETYAEAESVAHIMGDDGLRQFYIDFTYAPLLDNDNKPFAVMVTAADVTEKVIARKMIEQAEEKARLAIASADLGTYELDFKTNRMVTSARFNAIWGIERTLDRYELASFIHPEDLPIRQRAHEEALLTGHLHYEVRLSKDRVAEQWVRIKGRILYDQHGEPQTLIGVVQDITEQKLFARELERLVQERTEELQAANEEIAATNEELSDSNNNLIQLNLELERFNYAASHDLQEPVRKIQTFIDILLRRSESTFTPRDKQYIEKIEASVSRMKTIIDDLLLYSHTTRPDQQLALIDLNTVLKNVESDLEVLIEQKNAIIEKETLPAVIAVSTQMHQLFLNLIANSLKFAKPNHTPIIKISVQPYKLTGNERTLSPKKRYVCITVSDNGIGFSQEYAEYIFELFKRLHSKNEYSGTGIGLSLCKKIVENHKGLIFAESQEGVGTRMNVVLPLPDNG